MNCHAGNAADVESSLQLSSSRQERGRFIEPGMLLVCLLQRSELRCARESSDVISRHVFAGIRKIFLKVGHNLAFFF